MHHLFTIFSTCFTIISCTFLSLSVHFTLFSVVSRTRRLKSDIKVKGRKRNKFGCKTDEKKPKTWPSKHKARAGPLPSITRVWRPPHTPMAPPYSEDVVSQNSNWSTPPRKAWSSSFSSPHSLRYPSLSFCVSGVVRVGETVSSNTYLKELKTHLQRAGDF